MWIASGLHQDDSYVCAHAIDLAEFINASPEDFILVECDEVFHYVKKGEVAWNDIVKQ